MMDTLGPGTFGRFLPFGVQRSEHKQCTHKLTNTTEQLLIVVVIVVLTDSFVN